MRSVAFLTVAVLAMVLAGCGLGNDESAGMALKVVQEYRPTASASTVAQRVNSGLPNAEWAVIKSSESLYRVVCRAVVSGQTKELVFGVNINKGDVMALNRDALAYTNPL